MKAALLIVLVAIALAACQHKPRTETLYLLPGATDLDSNQAVADGPGKRDRPKVLMIRAPARADAEPTGALLG
jgi:hypothetical protein